MNEQFPSLMPTLYRGSMATVPKPYASLDEMWKAFGDLSNSKTPAINGDIFWGANDSTGYTLVEPRYIRVPLVYRHYTHAPDHGITRHNKPQRKHSAPRAPDDTYRITEVYYDTHEEEAKIHTAVDCDTCLLYTSPSPRDRG